MVQSSNSTHPQSPCQSAPAWTGRATEASHIALRMKVSRAFTRSARQQKQLYGFAGTPGSPRQKPIQKGPGMAQQGGGPVFCPGPLREPGIGAAAVSEHRGQSMHRAKGHASHAGGADSRLLSQSSGATRCRNQGGTRCTTQGATGVSVLRGQLS